MSAAERPSGTDPSPDELAAAPKDGRQPGSSGGDTGGGWLRGVSSIWITYGLLALIGLAWEVAVSADLIDGRFISQPSQVLLSFLRLSAEAEVRTALAETVYALAVSFTVGAALGLVIGMVLGMNRLLRDAFLPFVIQLLGIPKSVFLPLFILVFGLGHGPGIAFGVVLSSIQVIINVVGGIDSIDKVHYQTARAYAASPLQTFTNVILPGATPGIFAGMWHGIRNAFIGVVVAQLFVSNIGVGFLVRTYSATFRIGDALALIFFIAVVVILVGNAWGALERRLSSWKGSVA